MPSRDEVSSLCRVTRSYLSETLLPFWIHRSPDGDHGGFLTYFDREGHPTGETTKTFLMQIRMLYTMASAHRAGYGSGRCADLARTGADFILRHYWDDEQGGWIWVADRSGNPMVTAKIGYGQCFALYAFSEYSLATGDERGRRAAEQTYRMICEHMADTARGGYYELMQRDWTPEPGGSGGGDRKSLDVHMHMMEALTTYYEMTRQPSHRRRLEEAIELILRYMLRPDSGTGFMQFTLDFQPRPAILFDHVWGRDKRPEDGVARPLDFTSYGHNVELAWLLLHAADVLGVSRKVHTDTLRRIADHTVSYGIDPEYGGVYVEGPCNGPTTLTQKQFWQQAEVIVGMLDAFSLFGEEKYWTAFRSVHDFIFQKFVRMKAGGEWYERVDRRGEPIDDSLGHAWKISYHTVRSMIQTVQRLERIEASLSP